MSLSDKRETRPCKAPPKASCAAVYALTPQGATLGLFLAGELGAELHLPRRLAERFAEGPARPFDSLTATVAELFHARSAHVFITAAGVAVRAIAPHLRGKDKDPAVLVLDQRGEFCVSLLSGHLGGANRLAEKVAVLTKGRAVITTATDCAGTPAVDVLAQDAGLAISDISRIKDVNAILAAGGAVTLHDPDGWLPVADMGSFFTPAPDNQAQVVVDWRTPPPDTRALWLHPPCLCLGVGCRRGVPARTILERITETFAARGATLASLCGLATVRAKEHEPGLREAAATLGVPLTFYPASELDAVEAPTPSERVARAVGTSSVCEAAAMLLAERDHLLMEKQTLENVTLALAVRRPE